LLRQTIHSAVRFLDDVIEKSKYPDARIAKMVQGNRRIGLGVMGFAEYLIHLGVPYASAQALKEAKRLATFMCDESHRASQQLARERGTFPFYEGSTWDEKGIAMRHASVTTIAPTGSISIIAGCSSGIEPLFSVGFVRETGQGVHLFEVSSSFETIARQEGFWSSALLHKILQTGSVQGLREVPEEIQELFCTAHEIPVSQHIRMQSAFQSATDHAVSKTVNLPARAKESDVREAFLLAWKLRCKGVTVYRYDSKPQQTLHKGLIGEALTTRPLLVAHSTYTGSCSNGLCLTS
jgi:ribonucleoside-diphosphate reductase alpha chain